MTDFYSVNQVGAFAQLPGDLSALGAQIWICRLDQALTRLTSRVCQS